MLIVQSNFVRISLSFILSSILSFILSANLDSAPSRHPLGKTLMLRCCPLPPSLSASLDASPIQTPSYVSKLKSLLGGDRTNVASVCPHVHMFPSLYVSIFGHLIPIYIPPCPIGVRGDNLMPRLRSVGRNASRKTIRHTSSLVDARKPVHYSNHVSILYPFHHLAICPSVHLAS